MTIRHSRVQLPDLDEVEDADGPVVFAPYNQAEIEDLLYGNDRPIGERLTRLQDARTELIGLIGEIDRAITELSAKLETDAEADMFGLAAPFVSDPGEPAVPVPPDAVEERFPEDDAAWDDGDAVPPEGGIE